MTLNCRCSTKVSAPVCHTGDVVSITIFCSINALMAEGFMHLTLNQAIKVRVLVGVLKIWVCSSKVEQVAVNHSVGVRFPPFPQIRSIFRIVEFRFQVSSDVINREDMEYMCTPPYLNGVCGRET